MNNNPASKNTTLRHQLEFFLPRIFLLVAVFMAIFSPTSEEMRTFSLVFLSILFEALPFMLLGSLAGGFIEEFVSRDRVTEMLPPGSKSVFLAAAVGFILPVCECAIVPVVRRLLRKGIPFSAAIAYLMAGPIVNPIVALSTAVAYFYDWRIVLIRLSLGYGAAVIIGFLVNIIVKEEDRLAPHNTSSGIRVVQISPSLAPVKKNIEPVESCGHDHHQPAGLLQRLIRAVRHGGNDFLEVACFLVVGAFVAAAAQTFVDRQSVMALLSEPWLAIAVMMGLAIALNLCSEADAFVAASFRQLVDLSGQMAFMVLGPMFDIKLFFMYFSVFSRRTAVTLALVTIIVVYLMMLVASIALAGVMV